MQTYWVRFEDIPIWEKCPKCTYISWSTCILHNKVLIFLKNEEKNILNIFLIFGDHCTVRGSLLLHSGGLVNYTGHNQNIFTGHSSKIRERNLSIWENLKSVTANLSYWKDHSKLVSSLLTHGGSARLWQWECCHTYTGGHVAVCTTDIVLLTTSGNCTTAKPGGQQNVQGASKTMQQIFKWKVLSFFLW